MSHGTAIEKIKFHEDEILSVLGPDGRPHVVLKPAVESIGLDYASQYTKLQGRSWATVGQCPTVAADGKTRTMVTVDVRTFLMLLATVDEGRVAEHVRPKLIAYQAEVADVIEAYWTGKQARIPQTYAEALRAHADEVDARTAAEAEALLWEQRARTERELVEAAKPKVEAYDDLIDADGDYALARAGQILGMGRQKFIEVCARLELIMNKPGHSDHLRPYHVQVKAGRFVVKARSFRVTSSTSGLEELRTEGTTYVTPKGLTHIRQLLHGEQRAAAENRLL